MVSDSGVPIGIEYPAPTEIVADVKNGVGRGLTRLISRNAKDVSLAGKSSESCTFGASAYSSLMLGRTERERNT